MTSWRAVRRSWTALRRRERGAAAVEFAVMLPVLLLLVMGVVDFGRIFVTGIAVASAARAGAQYGAQSPEMSANTAAMSQAARNDFPTALGTVTIDSLVRQCRCPGAGEPLQASCTTSCGGGYGAPRVYVVVRAKQSVNLLFPYPGLPAVVPVVRTATVRVQ